MPIAILPSELLLVVLDYATYERDVFRTAAPALFAYPPSRTYRESSAAARASLSTKLALTTVCSAWRGLAEQFLYSVVVITRLDQLTSLCEALCSERGAPPGAPSCFDGDGLAAHVPSVFRRQTSRGWWTRRLDFAVTKVAHMADGELDAAEGEAWVLRVSLLFRACPNLQIIVNTTRPPHWFNLIGLQAATYLNRASVRVISYETCGPRIKPRQVARLFRQAAHLTVLDGVIELLDDCDDGSSSDDEQPAERQLVARELELIRVPFNECARTAFSRAHFPALHHIALGAVDGADDGAYLARFLAQHARSIVSIEFLDASDSAGWAAVLACPALRLAAVVFDHAHAHRLRARALPSTVTHVGVRFRRLQAGRAAHRALLRGLALFEHARVVRFLHPRLVADLMQRHAEHLAAWFAPLAVRGVRLEGPDGELLWPTS